MLPCRGRRGTDVLIEARQVAAGSVVETGVCIIGAGAAGIALACELALHAIDVCVLESGGLEPDDAAQALNAAEIAALPYTPLDANRQRALGGATNLWAGWCRPLDDLDFSPRAWVPHSGWPLARAALLPYYARAHALCELGPCEYDATYWAARRQAPQLALPPERAATRIFQLSPPTRFGALYRDRLSRAPNVTVLLHATALELQTDETAGRVTAVRVASPSGSHFAIAARRYVLAGGGIENARLLLLSNAVQAAGLGNGGDAVGRYFMEHLHFPAGAVASLPRGTDFPALYGPPRAGVAARLALPPALQERARLLHSSTAIQPIYLGDRSPLARAAMRVVSSVRQRRSSNRPLRRQLARDPALAAAVDHSFGPPPRLGRPLVGLSLHHTVEQAPNPESRVRLGTTRDALGLPRARLEWRTTALDEATARRLPALIGAAFAAAAVGQLAAEPEQRQWPPPPLQGLRGHHMGTTRMSASPQHGVVDVDCRVHGVANLFVAGSSVFPTAGAGTPTLTIVALALRLADHLATLQRERN